MGFFTRIADSVLKPTDYIGRTTTISAKKNAAKNKAKRVTSKVGSQKVPTRTVIKNGKTYKRYRTVDRFGKIKWVDKKVGGPKDPNRQRASRAGAVKRKNVRAQTRIRHKQQKSFAIAHNIRN